MGKEEEEEEEGGGQVRVREYAAIALAYLTATESDANSAGLLVRMQLHGAAHADRC